MDKIIRDSILTGIAKVVSIGMVLIVCSAVAVGQDKMPTAEKKSMVYNGIRVTQDATRSPVLNKIISIHAKAVPLLEAVKEIAAKSKLELVYNSRLLEKKNRPVTIRFKQVTVEKALWSALKGTGLRFAISADKQLVLLERKEANNPSQVRLAPVQETITGTVTDAQSGETLPGVNILVKGTSTGASTDANGTFELTVESLQDTLVISFVGYQTQEVPINGRTEINIAMQSQAISGEEMVVIGYGEQQRQNLTGAQSSVNFENQELETQSVTDVGQALSGKVSGVRIIQSSGQPGSTSTIQIRGNNSISAASSPLIVVDGNPLPEYNLNMINPTDIESVEILKDAASTAIYGSRAANGVVLITTKSGEEGETKVNINYSYGFQQVSGKQNVMNASEYAQATIDAAQNGWIDQGGDPNAPNTIEARGNYNYVWPEALEHPENLPDTDWQDVIYRSVPMQKVNVSVSGGNERGTVYTLSGGYVNQKGILIQSNFKKYSLNMKVNNKVSDWLKIGGMANLNYDNQQYPYGRIIEWAQQYPSIYPIYDEKTGHLGSPTTEGFSEWSGSLLFRPHNGHPLYRQYDDLNQNRINGLGNIFANFNIFQELDYKTTINYYYKKTEFNNYEAVNHDLGPSRYTQGVKSVNHDKSINYNWQNRLTYDNDLEDHHLNAVLGFEYNKDNYYSTFAQRKGYDNDLVHYLPSGEEITGASEEAIERVLVSAFGRVNYNFKNRYIASASIRYDGSSRFGPNNKWGAFPAFSVGWRISNESFMEPVSAVSNLKLRGSYGFTGNDNFSDYAWISSLNKQRLALGNNTYSTYTPSGITNRNLEWEKSQQLDVGINLGLFNNRIVFEGDYYRTISDHLLLNVPIPAITGFTNNLQNAGKLKNQGFELALETHNLVGELNWTTNFNFSHNQSEVVSLGGDSDIQYFGVNDGLDQVNKVGEPIYSFYTYVFDGVYENQAQIDADPASYPGADPGDGKYVDINSDGKLDAQDRKVVGSIEPDFSWGVTNTFSYKRFDLSFLFQGVQGGLIFDHNVPRSQRWHEGRNYSGMMVDRWRSPDNPGDGQHPKLTTTLDGMRSKGSSNWLYSGSYVKLKTLTLGYSFSQTLLTNIGLSQLRVFFTGRNLFTVTPGPIPDPESNNRGSGATPGNSIFNRSNTGGEGVRNRGITGYAYPSAKIYSFGINVTF